MNVGLYFGSFNPVHLGHLIIATLIRESATLDEIWFVVSPQNPFKESKDLADEKYRLDMVKLALKNSAHLKVSDIEFQLEKPSYTHITLKALTKQYPGNKFFLLMGEDISDTFSQWKESEWIQDNFDILIYNRGERKYNTGIRNAEFYKLPKIDISSTVIRERIKNQLPVHFLVPDSIEQYIIDHRLYTDLNS